MKTEYKSDLKKNYLVVEPEEEVNSGDYDVRMMEQNRIQGFLPVQVRMLDGSCYLYYEITAMQQVSLAYGKKQLQRDDIRHIFSEVRDILESARKYLLRNRAVRFSQSEARPGQILLDPQYMYMELETGRIGVCYLPVKESSFSVLPLAEFILKKLNHEDSDAVSLGYGFYQKAAQPNFSLSDTLCEMLAGTYRGGQENGPVKTENYGNVYKRAYEDGGESDFYEVQHKERKHVKTKEKKNRKKSRIFRAVHPAVLFLTIILSAVLGVLLYFQQLGFREEEGPGEGLYDPYPEEIQRLRKELYGYEGEKRAENGYAGERIYQAGMGQEEERIYGKYEDAGRRAPRTESRREQNGFVQERTQYLGEMGEKAAGLRLLGECPEKYPEILIGDRILIVGKKKSQADIILDEASVSRIHARLEYHHGEYYVMDLGSRNGTYLNGMRLNPREQEKIRDGDRIAFANINYRVTAEDETEMTQLLR